MFGYRPKFVTFFGVIETIKNNEKNVSQLEVTIGIEQIYIVYNRKHGRYFVEMVNQTGGWEINVETYNRINEIINPTNVV